MPQYPSRNHLKTTTIIGALAVASIGSISSAGNSIDPRGVFFHSYTGPFSGIEWIDIRATGGENRYQFSDIRGLVPYQGSILPDGQITWDTTSNTGGSGAFTDSDNASQTLRYNGQNFPSTLRRAPGTDADFITQIQTRESGNTALSGNWDLTVQQLNASTGDLVSASTLSGSISVTDDIIRLEYDDGTYYQGVFESENHAGFRVVVPDGNLPDQFASFEGSETSLNQNLLGDLRFDGLDAFNATFLTQTRRPPGAQQQFVYTVTGTRVVPAPSGLLISLSFAVLAVPRRRRC
ncbi:MAG: hypothetical protein JJ974_04810 [Phycisphaerales bacterium]|nr:hypothetical protein [Phycisphaerales bacterium]